MKPLNQFLALSLAVMTVGTLAACNQAGREVGMGQDEAADTTVNVDTGESERQSAVRGTSEGTAGHLADLKPGQPLSYYTQQFEQQGYEVVDMNRQGDRVTYDLMKRGATAGEQQDRHRVELMRPQGQENVSDVRVAQGRQFNTRDQKDQQTSQMVQKIEQLKPGKKPIEYLTQLTQFGQVREYQMDEDKATVELEANDKTYNVEMALQGAENQQTVSNIQVDENNIWGFDFGGNR